MPDRRSVLLLIADDWSPLAGCYGSPVIRTPHVDGLARRATRFTHAFCTSPSCAASRANILTGHYSHSHGQYGHSHGVHNFHTAASMPSIPKRPGAGEVECDALVNWSSIAPTVFDWCGVEPPDGLPEGSLMPVLDQEHPPGWDETFLSHEPHRRAGPAAGGRGDAEQGEGVPPADEGPVGARLPADGGDGAGGLTVPADPQGW